MPDGFTIYKQFCKQSIFKSKTSCKGKAMKLYYEKTKGSKKNLKLIKHEHLWALFLRSDKRYLSRTTLYFKI